MIPKRFRLIIAIFSLLAIYALFALWVIPQAQYIYYQNKAGILVGETLSSIDGNAQSLITCSLEPITGRAQQVEIEAAISYLEKAQRAYSKNPYNDLLLGRAYCLVGEFDKAIVYLNAYRQAKPENPLGNIELGFAYDAIGNTRKAKKAWSSAGLTSMDFLQVSESDRKIGAFKEALAWETRVGLFGENSFDTIDTRSLEGLSIVENFSTLEGWAPYPSNSSGDFSVSDGILTMRYYNEKTIRDIFTWTARTKIPIVDYDNLIVRLYGKEGTFFSVEVVIDGKRIREINYMPVPQQWNVLTITISGNLLEEIVLGISEPTLETAFPEYELFIDWLGIK